MPPNTGDRKLFLENQFVPIDFDELDASPEDACSNSNGVIIIGNYQRVSEDCVGEKTFWKYARSILYLNAWISPFRVIVYVLVCLFRLLLCDWKRSKDAARETLKSILVLFAALAAVYVTQQEVVEISNCIAEVLFDFVIGGLTLQICLGLGDALINAVLDCSAADLTIDKVLESILEPIVFFGGFFSIYSYFNADKRTVKAQHAKYSAFGNLIGSSIAVTLASYLCVRIETESHHTVSVSTVGVDSSFGYEQLDFNRDVTSLYAKKNSILAMNILARMFAEGIAKCVEHKCTKKVHS